MALTVYFSNLYQDRVCTRYRKWRPICCRLCNRVHNPCTWFSKCCAWSTTNILITYTCERCSTRNAFNNLNLWDVQHVTLTLSEQSVLGWTKTTWRQVWTKRVLRRSWWQLRTPKIVFRVCHFGSFITSLTMNVSWSYGQKFCENQVLTWL